MSDYDELQELVGEVEFDDQPIELVDDGMGYDGMGETPAGGESFAQAALDYAAKATAPLDTNVSEQYSYVAGRTGYTAPEAAYKPAEGGFFDSLTSAITSDKAADLFGSLAKAGIAATPGILTATQSKQRQASQVQAQQRQISDGSLAGTLVKVGIGLTVAYVGYRILKKYL